MMKRWTVLTAIVVTMFLSIHSFGAEILIWDNDFDSYFWIPDSQTIEGCEEAIQRTLLANGHQVIVTSSLPEDLSGYDAVFIVLGFFCST